MDIFKVGRTWHNVVLQMHAFKHNKSHKLVFIRVKGRYMGCPVCSIMEYLAWRNAERVGADEPLFIWHCLMPVTSRQVLNAIKEVLKFLREDSSRYLTQL